MSLKYNQINLSVNGKYLLSDNTSISINSNQEPIYSLNTKNVFDNAPTNFKGTLTISYFLEPGNEPNYTTITGLINNTTIPLQSLINIGNIYITGYLSNYSLQLLPGQLIKSTASYDIFTPITGNLISQNVGDWNNFDINNSSGISNYWSVQLYSGASPLSNSNVLQFDYSVSIKMTPIYSLGNPYPSQIYINNISENLNLLGEKQINPSFSGKAIDLLLPELQNIKINNISSLWDNTINNSITIPITGMIMQSFNSTISNDNEIFFGSNFSKYH